MTADVDVCLTGDTLPVATRDARFPAMSSAPAAAEAVTHLPVVAIVGRPNVGKSTFFARASGRFAETANVPGTTISVARRDVVVAGRAVTLVDLPGTLAMADRSDGLPAFWSLLLDTRPDAILVVVDAGHLGQHLPLALACRDLGFPIVVAANLADEADAHGIGLDLGRLSQLLVAPVHRTIGRRGLGVDAAVADAVRLAGRARASGPRAGRPSPVPPYRPDSVRAVGARAAIIAAGGSDSGLPTDLADAVEAGRIGPLGAATIAAADRLEPERWEIARRWADQVERRADVRETVADRIARAIVAPKVGLPLFALVTLLSLAATMVVGTLLAAIVATAWAATASPFLVAVIPAIVPIPALANALLWALDSGLLAMLSVGIPFILSFYVVIAALEDSGYLASAAVLSDRVFNAVGLPGRAAIPILAATGCNVPAIYGTRVLDTRRERVLASFLITLTPCSARSAVVIAALVPFAGPGAALAAFGVVAIVAILAGAGANALVPGRQSPLVLELPPLRRPIARAVALKAWYRFRAFVVTATPVMLASSLALGLLYETGATTAVEGIIAPVFTGLLGLPPVAGIAIVLAFLRKELALQLLLVLAAAEYGTAISGLGAFMSAGQLFVYAVVAALSIPCAATFATLVGEFGWRPSLAISGATLGLALGAGSILARLLGIA